VVMSRDKRQYRFVLDGRYGRKNLAESSDISVIVAAITRYVALRLVERERAISETFVPLPGKRGLDLKVLRVQRRWRIVRMFILGLIVGSLALFCALWIAAWPLAKLTNQ
jgi:hypothetical protein